MTPTLYFPIFIITVSYFKLLYKFKNKLYIYNHSVILHLIQSEQKRPEHLYS